jgi:hypothetical protein
MEKGEEIITLQITIKSFTQLYNMGLIDLDEKEYKIKKIEPHDVEYPEDEQWVKLKDESRKIYKKLKEYEFNKRHNGK